jgi:hypothetical protein
VPHARVTASLTQSLWPLTRPVFVITLGE